MIHLFNKIYIKPPAEFTETHTAMMMFPRANDGPSDPFLAAVNERSFGSVLLSSNSLSEAFDQLGGEDAFFQTLLTFDPSKRLILYVNSDDMLTLLCKWYKTLLPNVTATTAHMILTLVYKRMEYIFGYTYNSIIFLTENAASLYRSVGQSLPPFADFEDAWNQATAFNITLEERNVLIAAASVEYQIATNLCAKVLPDQKAFEAKVIRMVRKVQIAAVVDVKSGILAKLHMLPEYDFNTQTLSQWVAVHPEYQVLVDPLFTPDHIEYVEDTYSYADLRQLYLNLIKLTEYGYDPVVDKAAHILDPDLTYADIIASELGSLYTRSMLGISVHAVVINSYLLDTVFNLYRDGNLATLAELSLV